MSTIQHLKCIHQFHRSRGVPPPTHPLISVVDFAAFRISPEHYSYNWMFDFYSIGLKKNLSSRIRYGQQEYDFDDGLMFFISPGQVINIQPEQATQPSRSGWILLIHPDFLWNTGLAKSIKQYEFFDYSVHEALFLSDKEEHVIANIIDAVRQELQENIDKFSKDIVISQLETLLNYSNRFYHRQFITRDITNHQILERLETLLTAHFNDDQLATKGPPTVQAISESLNLSPGYLRTVLKMLTGKNTQEHIQEKLIQKAKEKLSLTALSVSEIAYELGFEHPQSFNKLFKSKTALSPLAFRQTFNQKR
jgi:AraC family transcriptional regulator, transcriptional activator of pobA